VCLDRHAVRQHVSTYDVSISPVLSPSFMVLYGESCRLLLLPNVHEEAVREAFTVIFKLFKALRRKRVSAID